VSEYRAKLYRLVFGAAAAYNIAFGLWAAARPLSFFAWFDLAPPLYPSLWACLGMVVGLYGLGYAYASWRLDRAAPFIAIGLVGKLLGPAGWILAVGRDELPTRTLALIFFNDLLWWMPFGLFLAEGTRVGAWLRRSAPAACAAANLAAFAAMATVLRPGTEIEPFAAERVAYISQHPALWRGGWSLWIAAALSLVAFFAWWGSHLGRPAWGLLAVAIASAGLVCDLAGESLLIGWLPRDYDRIAPVATMMTGAAANGLYTVAGVVLTVATRSLSEFVRTLTWAVWLAGAAVTASTLARAPMAIAISTTALFLMFCPWVIVLARSLGGQARGTGKGDRQGGQARGHPG
jgi:hypothetical protein